MKNEFMMALIVVSLALTTWAQGRVGSPTASGTWKKLGESTVFFYGNSASWTVFQVDSVQVDQAKLRVLNSSLFLKRMLVFYSTGEVRGFSIQSRVNAGTVVGLFLLDPGRLITSVALRYETADDYANDRAIIQLYGRSITGGDNHVNIYKRPPD